MRYGISLLVLIPENKNLKMEIQKWEEG